MNKFMRDLMDTLFCIKVDILFKQIGYLIVFLFISMLILTGVSLFKNTQDQFQQYIIVIILIISFVISFLIMFKKLVSFFGLGAAMIWAGLFTQQHNIIEIGLKFLIVGSIILMLHVTGEIIEIIKKESKKKNKKQ